jgi:hypothetical protein
MLTKCFDTYKELATLGVRKEDGELVVWMCIARTTKQNEMRSNTEEMMR